MGININPKNGEISKNISFLSKNLISKKKLTFGDFDIKKEILWGIFELGYKYPSPIQEESIPKILIGRDIIARSKNGTGKTASYLIPVIQKTNIDLLKIQSLIIVPTRELALQVSQVTKSLSKYIRNIKITVTTGGTGLKEDIIRMYQSIHILIGTPGRILDILMNTISKSLDCKMLVLDEADKLLSNEFFKVVEEIQRHFYIKIDRRFYFLLLFL